MLVISTQPVLALAYGPILKRMSWVFQSLLGNIVLCSKTAL